MTGEDSVEHVCWHCPMAQRMWSLARRKFRHNREFWSLGQAICRPKEWSPLIQNLWSTAVFSGMVAIWQLRNSVVMGNERIRIETCHSFIKNQIDIAARMSKANSYRNALEEDILSNWNLRTNHISRAIKECHWLPPAANVIKANTDGASTDSNSGLGVVFRDCDCNIILTVCKNIGDMNSFQAECHTIISALEVAMSTTWREANFSADKASKVRLSLIPHILYSYEERPTWLTDCPSESTDSVFDRILGPTSNYECLERLTGASCRGNHNIPVAPVDLSGNEGPLFVPEGGPKESHFRVRGKKDSSGPRKSSTSKRKSGALCKLILSESEETGESVGQASVKRSQVRVPAEAVMDSSINFDFKFKPLVENVIDLDQLDFSGDEGLGEGMQGFDATQFAPGEPMNTFFLRKYTGDSWPDSFLVSTALTTFSDIAR
ncbi:hypothetical protein FRX31_028624 [Thalictrum thalictroides]|uniref:RNase H type-1 domain-containing protein n=1 Tax=Thalictrum thalictroides TaxID=46969 RepID=A0A7J6VAH7_THATH|nr:hypothetical protein FRX31_028624 [Thalictrum thalictroides]